MQNRWDEIAELLLSSDDSGLPSSPDPSPQRPGLVTGPSAHKLMQAAKHGRLSSAWKQLFSYGLAPPTVETRATLESKWRPPQTDYQLEGRFLQPAEVAIFLDAAAVQRATRALKPGTAPDALGWTSESWKVLASRPELLPVFRELLLQYVTGHSGSVAQDLVNASRLVPLYKRLFRSGPASGGNPKYLA